MDYRRDVSATEIINELPKLTAAELQAVRRKLMEIAPEESAIDLRECGIDERQAADLCARLKSFAEDWERPEASVYDNTPARSPQPRLRPVRVGGWEGAGFSFVSFVSFVGTLAFSYTHEPHQSHESLRRLMLEFFEVRRPNQAAPVSTP